jgi:hypothetical protein
MKAGRSSTEGAVRHYHYIALVVPYTRNMPTCFLHDLIKIRNGSQGEIRRPVAPRGRSVQERESEVIGESSFHTYARGLEISQGPKWGPRSADCILVEGRRALRHYGFRFERSSLKRHKGVWLAAPWVMFDLDVKRVWLGLKRRLVRWLGRCWNRRRFDWFLHVVI